MTLGTIVCNTNFATVDALVAKCGLRAEQALSADEFNIVSSSSHGEPEVEDELFAMALHRLRSASDEGVLPDWRLISRS